jgi:biopolymer transport protein ExbB
MKRIVAHVGYWFSSSGMGTPFDEAPLRLQKRFDAAADGLETELRGKTFPIWSLGKRARATVAHFWRRLGWVTSVGWLSLSPALALAQDEAAPAANPAGKLDIIALLHEGGAIGYVIMLLSVVMIALVIEHYLAVRRRILMPDGLADEVHRMIGEGQFAQAEQVCRNEPSYLSYMLLSGLAEVRLGYAAVEKAMEDAAAQQAARLFRKLEYFTVIGTVTPMLGLLGTVWGMILAFMEFELKANPSVSELAPGIYKALVTTLQGLCVAIPSLAAFTVLRNRVDELVAQTSLTAEYVFSNYKRTIALRRQEHQRRPKSNPEPSPDSPPAES